MLITQLILASVLIRIAAPFVRRFAAVNDLRNPKLRGPVTIVKQEPIKGYWLPEELGALERGDLEVLHRGQERLQAVEGAKSKWLRSMN